MGRILRDLLDIRLLIDVEHGLAVRFRGGIIKRFFFVVGCIYELTDIAK